MKTEQRAVRWGRIIVLEILMGIVFLCAMFLVSSRADIAAAEEQLKGTMEYMKEQCNNSVLRDLASESKSLLRVTESVEQVHWRLKYGRGVQFAAAGEEELLEAFAKDSYLHGLFLMKVDGTVLA